MTQRSPTQRLIEIELGRDLADVLAETPQSWRSLARYVLVKTGISVSHEALRSWLAAPAEFTAA